MKPTDSEDREQALIGEKRKGKVIRMKIGCIGLGNMASAILGGILSRGMACPEEILGFDKLEAAGAKAAERFGIRLADNNRQVAEESDLLFLAVKPQFFPEVLTEIGSLVKPETVIISIAAGKSIAYLEAGFSGAHKIVRCMPNTPALVGEGCTGVCCNGHVTEAEMEQVMKLLNCFGKAYRVAESMMDAVVAVSGSSPAYVFLLIEAMADGAVQAGMPRAQAYEFAAQAVLGSAKMVLETGKHPAELKDMVCSPAGTTIEAVKVLEEKGFRAAVMDAMEACVERNRQL